MRHLLDASVLLALGLTGHSLHSRVVTWLRSEPGPKQVMTCAITELAFVRILTQDIYGYSIAEAKGALKKLKAIPELNFTFLSDDEPASNLPSWAVRPSQLSDGHLLELAKKHEAVFVTLDEKIPGAFLLPR